MSDPELFAGCKLEIKTQADPEVYTKVAGLQSFSAFDGEAKEIDVTDADSTAKEFKLGLPDNGSFVTEHRFLPSDPGQQAMSAARDNQELKDFHFVLADGTTYSFSGYVKKWGLSGQQDDRNTVSSSIRISGAVTKS